MGTSIPDVEKGTCELPEKGGQRAQTGVSERRVLSPSLGRVASPSRCPGRPSGAVSLTA